MCSNLPAVKPKLPAVADNAIPRDLVKEIAMDIGKDVASYIEVMYPDAVKAASSTFLLSVRNSIYNQIMAALEMTDETSIKEWLRDRKSFRRKWRATYRKLRVQPQVIGDDGI